MEESEHWVANYGADLEGDLKNYPSWCDTIEDRVLKKLSKIFKNVSYDEDSRDGETYSVRFSLESPISPVGYLPKQISLRINSHSINIELLQIKMNGDVYSLDDGLPELFNSFVSNIEGLDIPFSSVATSLLSQAILSYEYNIYDGAVILCRALVDSCIYLACIWRKDSQSGQLKRCLPKEFCSKNTGQENKQLNWNNFKKAALNRGLETDDQLNEIDVVRECGNFAAHIGIRQTKEADEWLQRYKKDFDELIEKRRSGQRILPKDYPPGYKLRTSSNEAYSTIEKTMKFIENLARNYA